MPGDIRHSQFPPTVPGVFIRADESNPNTSCIGIIDVFAFEEGSSSGINTLFTIEQTLAQQTYFSYAMGNYGFDLISWYTVKEFLETREKMLSLKRAYKFDPHTQYLTFYPGPLSGESRFYGIVSCYLERPLAEVIRELWVYQYARSSSLT